MTNLRRLNLLVLILMFLLILQSCSQKKSVISPESPVNESASVKDTSQTSSPAPAKAANLPHKKSLKKLTLVKHTPRSSDQESAQAVNLAKEHMETGEYQKAIDVYNVGHRKHPDDQALIEAYVECIETIKSAADKALGKEDFVSAGRNYNVLLKNYPHFKGFDKKLSFDSNQLDAKLSDCEKVISRQGFQEYRKGNLSGAIVLWEDLLAINPHNTDIKEALRTAKLQQKNLQEKE